jgi:hypothetical protein
MALRNWNYEIDIIIRDDEENFNVENFLASGFLWSLSNQGCKFWESIASGNIPKKFKDKTGFFHRIKIWFLAHFEDAPVWRVRYTKKNYGVSLPMNNEDAYHEAKQVGGSIFICYKTNP